MKTAHLMLLLMPLFLQLIGLTFAVLTDSYLRRGHRTVMLLIVGLVLCLVFQNVLESYLSRGTQSFARILSSIAGYSLRPLILLLFLHIVSSRRSHRIGWLLVGLNCAVHLTALFSTVCFSFDAGNVFHRGPLGYTCHGISALLLLELVAVTIREYGRDRKQSLWIPLFNAALILGAMLADTQSTENPPVTFLTVAVVSCCVFYYIWLHQQFVRQHERPDG